MMIYSANLPRKMKLSIGVSQKWSFSGEITAEPGAQKLDSSHGLIFKCTNWARPENSTRSVGS